MNRLMNLQPVPESLLRLGEPLPAPIRDPRGNLLLPKGGVIGNEQQLRRLMVLKPHVQPHQIDTLRQPWVQAIGRLVLRNETLGRIAEVGALPPRAADTPSAIAQDSAALGLADSIVRNVQQRQTMVSAADALKQRGTAGIPLNPPVTSMPLSRGEAKPIPLTKPYIKPLPVMPQLSPEVKHE